MHVIWLLLLAQPFNLTPHTSCVSAGEFWTPDNSALESQSFESIIQAPPTTIGENFAIYHTLYKNAKASFKVIKIQNIEDWKKASHEVEVLRKVSHLPRATTILECVEGENYIGIFMLPFNNNLLKLAEKNENIESLKFTEIIYNAARALNDLHKIHIVHGKILAENFYLKGEDQVLIGNFAFSKAIENTHQAPQVVTSYGNDAFEFSLMVLGLENNDFKQEYYELLKAQKIDDYRDSQFQTPLLELLKKIRNSGNTDLQKLVFTWLTSSLTNKGSLLPKIVNDIESLVTKILLEQREKNIGFELISKDTLVSYLGGKNTPENMKINELIEKPQKNRGEVLIDKAKSKLKESLNTERNGEENVQAASSWFYKKYKAFCAMMNNLKKKILHVFFLVNFKTSKKAANVKIDKEKPSTTTVDDEKSPNTIYIDILPMENPAPPAAHLTTHSKSSSLTANLNPNMEKGGVQSLQHSRLLALKHLYKNYIPSLKDSIKTSSKIQKVTSSTIPQ